MPRNFDNLPPIPFQLLGNPQVQLIAFVVAALAFGGGYWVGHNGVPGGITIPNLPGGGSAPGGAGQDNISVHFSPKGGCEQTVVDQIHAARQSIHVQAYSFTSRPITDALLDAARRGVAVSVVLDKADNGEYSETAGAISAAGIPLAIDPKHAIAHKKIMLMDGRTIVTGSFNFTYSAEHSNAENLLVIQDKPQLYAAYEQNFQLHLGHSDPVPAGTLKVAPPRGRGGTRDRF